MALFIAVLIVMVIMLYFMYVTLKAGIENANRKVNKFFLDKIEEFDEEFDEKIDKIEELTENRDVLRRQVKSLKEDMISFKTSPFYAPRPVPRSVYVPVARYIDNDFFEEYKSAKDMLKMDKPQIILNIYEKVPYSGNLDMYETALACLKVLEFDVLFELTSLPSMEQLKVVDELFEEREEKFFVDYIINEVSDPEKFDILDFVSYLKKIVNKHDPHLYVRTGEVDENLSGVHELVVSDYDDNICEGIKIIYQNKVYDYSIYKSRKKTK